MPDGDQVQFQSPTSGVIQGVPPEHWEEALGSGYKPVSHKVMYSPEGERGMVPNEQLAVKMKAGYQTTPKTGLEKQQTPAPEDTGTWGRTKQFSRDILGGVKSMAQQLPGMRAIGDVASGNGREAALDVLPGARLIPDALKHLREVQASDVERQKEGRSLPYRALAGAAQATEIASPEPMEEAARHGDPAGVLTHAAAQAAPLVVGEALRVPAVRRGIESVTRPVTGPIERIATRALDTLRVPEAQKAMTQAIQPGVNVPRAQESISIAGPRIQQIREAQGIEIPKKGPEAIKAVLDLNREAKTQILQAIEDRMGPVADLRPTATEVSKGIRSAVDDLTLEQEPGAKAAMERRAGIYEKENGNAWSIRQMEERMHTLNSRLANVYSKPTVGEARIPAEAEIDLAEARELRKLIDQSVEKLSGKGVKDLKREYGAQRDVEKGLAREYAKATRQKGAPLWEGLAYLQAAGDVMSGNVLGAARAAGTMLVGKRLQTLRDSGYLLNQSFHGDQAFRASPAIPPHAGPAAPAGLLNAPPSPATPASFQQSDTSGPVRGGRYTTPAALIPERPTTPATFLREIPRAAREEVRPKGLLPSGALPPTNIPPGVEDKFATEPTGTAAGDETKLGARGQGGIRIPIKGMLPPESGLTPPPKLPESTPKISPELGKKAIASARGVRTPNPAMMKSIGLTLRSEFPEGYYDFQDLQTSGSIGLKKEGFSEQALRDKVKAHREAIKRTPPEGKSEVSAGKAKDAQEAASEMPPVQKTTSPEELADAEGTIRQEVGMMQSMDRLGRYFDESSEESHILTGNQKRGERAGGGWRGVKSGRSMMPFLREHPDISPSQAERALEKDGTNPTYQRMMRAALEFIRRSAGERKP